MPLNMKVFTEPVAAPEYPFRPQQIAEIWLTLTPNVPHTHVGDVFTTGILSENDGVRLAEMMAVSPLLYSILKRALEGGLTESWPQDLLTDAVLALDAVRPWVPHIVETDEVTTKYLPVKEVQ